MRSILFVAFLFPGITLAQQHTVYGHGSGQSWGAAYTYNIPNDSLLVLSIGIDAAQEGRQEDYTQRREGKSIRGNSINAIFGPKIQLNDRLAFSPLLLVGMRSSQRSCDSGQSYLGYDCYADEDPSYRFDKANYGGVLVFHIRDMALGFRYTVASKSAVVGYTF